MFVYASLANSTYICKVLYIENKIIMIEIHEELWKTVIVLITPLPLYITKMINPFLNSGISADQDKLEGHSANGKILIKGIENLLKISFTEK